MPLLLLLFVGSGCAALIYEIVWFQLLQLVIGSSVVSLGVLLGHVHGRHVSRQPSSAARRLAAASPAARLRGARARHRRHRPADSVGHAAHRRHLHGVGRARRRRALRPRHRRGHLPAAADAADGRDAAGGGALGRDDAAGRLVARILLRRQHRRRRDRQPRRRLLSAARLRHGGRDLCRRRAQLLVAGVGLLHAPRTRLPAAAPVERSRPSTAKPAPGAWAVYVAIGLSGHDGARGGSDLDAHSVAAVRRHGLHLLADSRRLSDRPGHRQQPRRRDRPRPDASARGARHLSGAALRRDCLDGVCH